MKTHCVCVCFKGGGDGEAVKEKRRLYDSVAVVQHNRDRRETGGWPGLGVSAFRMVFLAESGTLPTISLRCVFILQITEGGKLIMITTNEVSQTSEEKAHTRFGELLVSKGLLNRRELTEALNEQRSRGGRLGDILVRMKMVSDEDVRGALAEHLSTERVHLDEKEIDMNVARLVPEAIAKRFNLVAFGEKDQKVLVAMADPLDIIAADTVTMKTGREIRAVLSSHREIHRAIEKVYHGSDLDEQRLRDLVEHAINTEDEEGEAHADEVMESALNAMEADISVEEAATRAPVIRYVDLLLRQAVKSRASDIHVEPRERTMTIRMRIDGVLQDMVPPPRKMQAAIATRIKILSRMDIAERRLPQDGRFKIKATGRDIDVRVSVIPTIHGEKVVMRILDSAAVNHNLDQLGFDTDLLAELKVTLTQPHGIIIVTGPTGSGKSTTLYSALNYLRDPRKNITTVEDPVEYRLDGINQIQVKPDIGLDFAESLRAILRQDPDIILIGEIRDKETIDIAIKASLTGHLVLSTFHTNDAPSAISRMVYMGVESYLLASTVNLIIAQRLVRRICEYCREPVEVSPEIVKRLNVPAQQAENAVFYHGRGCPKCSGTGYLGRLPIFEFLVMDREVRDAVSAGVSEAKIRQMSRERGYQGLLGSGVDRMLEGQTTAEEVLGAAFSERERAERAVKHA
ncbi:MAG TPA: ATPase, T2SS/T4P/T4SS family [Sedimentisphaerales bacterium]|nr:ATPase, T2SS/T4P/T4SS family [Sedimentisphaerales bacterium]